MTMTLAEVGEEVVEVLEEEEEEEEEEEKARRGKELIGRSERCI